MSHPLAQVKIEDVFRSTQQSIEGGGGGEKLAALLLAAVAMIVLLAVLQHRRRNGVAPKTLNHRGKLLREVAREMNLKSAEVKQLRRMAEEQKCSSPLVLLLCPSILSKGVQGSSKQERKVLAGMGKRR